MKLFKFESVTLGLVALSLASMFALTGCLSTASSVASAATGTVNCKYTYANGTGFCIRLYNVNTSQAAAACTAAGYTITTTCPAGWTQY